MDRETNIILYGKPNKRKTTTLRILAAILAGKGDYKDTIEASIKASLYKRKGKSGRFIDARIIVEYRNELVFIATGGDSWIVCRENYDFFRGSYSNLMDVYIIDGGGLRALTNSEKNIYKKKAPLISISACRPQGDKNGAIKAIHSYSEVVLNSYRRQIWIKSDSSKDSKAQAYELFNLIDLLFDLGNGKILRDVLKHV